MSKQTVIAQSLKVGNHKITARLEWMAPEAQWAYIVRIDHEMQACGVSTGEPRWLMRQLLADAASEVIGDLCSEAA